MKTRLFGIPQIFNFDASGDGGGSGESSYKDSLPAELKELTSIKDINSIPDLVKSFDHAQTLVGKTRLPIPESGASTTDWDSYYKSIGRPDGEKGSGYTLFDGTAPTLPEGVTRNEATETKFKELFHKLGLNNTQARGIYDGLNTLNKETLDTSKTVNDSQLDEWDKQIRTDFGSAYDQNMAVARQAVQKLGSPEMLAMLNETQLTNHPEMIKFCAKIGDLLVEHHGSSPGSAGSQYILTPEQAKEQIQELQMNKDFMALYTTRGGGPSHKAAVEKMQKLFSQAHPQLQP